MAEYVVYFQILEHFEKNNLFHPNHHGSLPNHSTATAIAQIFNICLEAAENKQLSAVCMIDQSACFDLLSHQILREKLLLYNFADGAIDWLMSYLGNRTQYVQVESKVSEELECGDYGAPQGSVLAGLLHIISSNDFPACHDDGEAIVYVDDDSDVVSDSNPEDLQEKIQVEASHSVQWLNDNRLCVAKDKSKLLVIGTNKLKSSKETQNKMKITVNNEEIAETTSEKLLGLVVNNSLTWKNHLYGDGDNRGLIPQLNTRVGLLQKLSGYMNKTQLKCFAQGIFYSKLIYCLPVFGNVFGIEDYTEVNRRHTSFTRKDNNKIQTLQNKVNQILTDSDPMTPTADLLRLTDSLSVHQMIAYFTVVMTHKIVQSGKPSYFADRMQPRLTSMRLRGKAGVLTVPRCTLSVSREGFVYRGTILYNSLPENIRNEFNLGKFKSKLREWIKVNIKIKPGSKFSSINQTRPKVYSYDQESTPPSSSVTLLNNQSFQTLMTNFFPRIQ